MTAPLDEKALAAAKAAIIGNPFNEDQIGRIVRAYLAASPSPSMEMEVVAWRVYHDWEGAPGEEYYIGHQDNGSLDRAVAVRLSKENAERIVQAQSALTAMRAEVARLVKIAQSDEWGATYFALLAQQSAAEAQVLRLTEENEALIGVRNENAKLKGQRDAALARIKQMQDSNSRMAEEWSSLKARIKALEEALRSDWHGVYLDGRNEHGSHVIRLPHRSIELEQDEEGDFLKPDAETILSDAEALGFVVGDAVVATFTHCTDDGFFSHYEYAGISSELTEMLYGSHTDQARSALKENSL